MERLDLGMIAGALTTLVVAMMITACSDGIEANPVPEYAYAKVTSQDDGLYGTTRNEAPSFGAFPVYDIGTGSPMASIRMDSLVIDINGKDLGICEDTVVSERGVVGDCVLPVSEPEIVLPCPDTRDGTMPQSTIPSVCYEHGYFFCSVVGHCLDKPQNVNVCGEIGSQQRFQLNH